MPESARDISMLSHKGDVAPSGIHARVTLKLGLREWADTRVTTKPPIRAQSITKVSLPMRPEVPA